ECAHEVLPYPRSRDFAGLDHADRGAGGAGFDLAEGQGREREAARGDRMTSVLVLVGTLVAVTVFGLVWRARQGRVRAARPESALPEQLRELVDPASPV